MKIKTVYFKATDNVDLNGILYSNNINTNKIMISVHGMETNCIKKREDVIAEKLEKVGIDYLIFNNRGHDLMTYSRRIVDGKKEKFITGTAYEEISESYEDIKGAMEYVISLGYKEIWISGHSLGSTKVVYTYNKMIDKKENELLSNIQGILLLSLIDLQTAQKIYLKERYEDLLKYAEKLKMENRKTELMPQGSFIHPISVKTYLRYFKDNKDIDIARYSDSQYTYPELNAIEKPLFMRWGNDRELILQKADELCEIVRNKIKGNREVDIDYIDGADHSYTNREEQLAEDILSFITKINEKK